MSHPGWDGSDPRDQEGFLLLEGESVFAVVVVRERVSASARCLPAVLWADEPARVEC